MEDENREQTRIAVNQLSRNVKRYNDHRTLGYSWALPHDRVLIDESCEVLRIQGFNPKVTYEAGGLVKVTIEQISF